jgi:hypothetical protein
VAQSHAKTEVVLVHIRREEVDQITRVKISKRKTAASAGLEAIFVWKRSSCVNSDSDVLYFLSLDIHWPENVEFDL